MFAPDYSATVAATKMWTNSTWAFYVLLDFYDTNIYSYLETSGGQSSNLYLNAVHFFNTSVN